MATVEELKAQIAALTAEVEEAMQDSPTPKPRRKGKPSVQLGTKSSSPNLFTQMQQSTDPAQLRELAALFRARGNHQMATRAALKAAHLEALPAPKKVR